MEQMIDFFRKLLESEQFMPRWVCGKWTPLHGWMYILADLTIFLAYMAIPIAMVYFVRKRWGDLPFKRVFWLFIAFIALCGTTHLLDAIIFWIPLYRLNALVLVLTAVVSVATVVAMLKVIPEALAYKSPRELQSAVDTKTAELEARIAELNRLSVRISRKKEQVENFAYITSHNLRSPAANLVGLVRELAKTDSLEKKNEIMPMLVKSGNQLMSTLDDISHVLTQSSPLEDARQIDFHVLVNEIKLELNSEFRSSSAIVKEDFGECKSIVYAPDHLKSIFINLISNAIRYAHPQRSPVIELKTWIHDEHVFLECKDNGQGIDLIKHGQYLFRLYKTFHENAEGKGIGLFLVRHQLESLGGSIDVGSTEGKGTTFVVKFGSPTFEDHDNAQGEGIGNFT
ncbi:MAG: HAMP domain-containing histidine kinase [Flavobacteriales bacterium]|nr:HAMP domain-containing histidine kinase [Flavobacteriales bacterium]